MNIPAIRLHCQQLAKPMFTDARSVVKWVGAMQAQQPSMAKLVGKPFCVATGQT